MKKSIVLFSLLLLVSYLGFSQKMHTVDTSAAKIVGDGWHKFSIKGVKYDVEVKDRIYIKGNIYWQDGTTYSGSLGSKGMHGRGTYTWPNGVRYEGSIKSNLRHGKGTLYLKDGSKFSGKWKQGIKHGKGKVFDSKGNVVKEGIWENGTFVKEEKID